LIEERVTSSEIKFFFFSVAEVIEVAASFAAIETLFFISPYASIAASVFFSLILISANYWIILMVVGSNCMRSSSVRKMISVSR
jgi:hypothetical protein